MKKVAKNVKLKKLLILMIVACYFVIGITLTISSLQRKNNKAITVNQGNEYYVSSMAFLENREFYDGWTPWPTVAEIAYSTKEPTNENVEVVITFNKFVSIVDCNMDIKANSFNSYSVVFEENGECHIEFSYSMGRKESLDICVDWIDREPPKVTNITYSTTTPTKDNVVATLQFNEDVTILNTDLNVIKNDEDNYSIVFDHNANYDVRFKDLAGNESLAKVEVTNIDNILPTVEVTYSETELTNKDVVATLIFSEDVTILSENVGLEKITDSKYTLTFKQIGKQTIEFKDKVGNTNTADIEVNNIDKTAPTVNVSYSDTKPTDKDVNATLKFDEDVNILTQNSRIIKIDDRTYTITFRQNDEIVVEFEDKAGNTNSTKVVVSNIDKDIPEVDVIYTETKPTTEDVVATLKFNEDVTLLTDNVGIVKVSNKVYQYTFTQNGNKELEFVDDAGNKVTIKLNVTCIDREPPILNVEYSNTYLTTEDVVATLKFSEAVTILNKDVNIVKVSDDTYTITFEENASYLIEFKDRAGNKSSATVTVTNIDKVAPQVDITYSTTQKTKDDVIVTLKFSEEVKIFTENLDFVKIADNTYTYTFTDNGQINLDFSDKTGNRNSAEIKVSNIDRIKPEVEVVYSTTEPTNKDVLVTLNFSEDVTILNKDIEFVKLANNKYQITYKEVGENLIEFEDEVGNKNNTKVVVSNIDRTIPEVNITYSETKLTNKDVVATLRFTKDVTILNEDLEAKKLSGSTYTITFEENKEYNVDFIDEAGNKNSTIVKVSNIDKKAPVVQVSYSETKLTNKDVIATVTVDKDVELTLEDEQVIKISNNKYQVTFDGNFRKYLEFKDKAENKTSVELEVTWIDKTAPTAQVSYSTTQLTNKDVVATLDFSEDVTILTEGIVEDGKITFTENGKHTIEFVDNAGNKNSVDVEVTWIHKVLPTVEVTYSETKPTNKDVVATLKFSTEVTILNTNITYIKETDDTYKITFEDNAKYNVEFEDKAGNQGNVIVEVTNIDKVGPKADVNYSENRLTNKDVIATVTLDKNVELVTKDEDTLKVADNRYEVTFVTNGNKTLEFIDNAGNKVTVKLEVTWIDKTIPTAKVTYSTTELTNQDVIATLTFSEDVTILTEDLVQNGQITFEENGKCNIEFVDKAGNTNSVDVEVTWIDKAIPTVEVTYNKTEDTNEDVVATLTFSKEVTILNKDVEVVKIANKTYTITFENNAEYNIDFVDEAGNTNSTLVKVSNIDKTTPVAQVSYSETEATNKDVIATISFSEDVTILTEDIVENGQIIFTENGKHTIKFVDKAGNTNSVDVEVTWIDKTIPTVEVTYSTTQLTNEDVIATLTFSEDVTILTEGIVEDGKITFTENGKHTVEFVDKAGNKTSVDVEVTWIHKVLPTVDITYSTSELTNENIVATLTFSTEVTILNTDVEIVKVADKIYTITFEDNTEYDIEFVDKAGNKNSTLVKVSNIDKTAPSAKVQYSTTKITNQDVVATITLDKDVELVTEDTDTLKVEDTKYEVTFKTNGDKTLEFIDRAGNKVTVKLNVTCIDKTMPTVDVVYSTTETTNKDVIATLKFSEEVTILSELNLENNIIFTENGKHTIEFVDKAGNKNSVDVEVTWIDKTIPTVDVTYSKTEATNEDVVATLTFSKEVTILNEDIEVVKVADKTYTITFEDNAEQMIEFVDKAGNTNSTLVKVSNIDKTAPVAKVTYSTTEPTNKDVIATLTFSEEVTILTEGIVEDGQIIFTENGKHTIEFVDVAGNKNKVNVEVKNIDKTIPELSVSYSTTELTNQDVVATLRFSEDAQILNSDFEYSKISYDTYTVTFTNNAKYVVEFEDEAGNRNSAIVEVTNIDKEAPKVDISYSKTEITNNDVIATLVFNEEVTLVTEETIEKVDSTKYEFTFTKNDVKSLEFVDRAGNKTIVKLEVTNIDKDEPTVEVTYSETELTNKDVVATLTFSEDVTILTEGVVENGQIVFTENGKHTIEFVDAAGNTNSVIVEVTWIDKTIPTVEVSYSTTEPTNEDVIATLTFSEEVTILTENIVENGQIVFTENAEYTIEFVDKAGNKNSVLVKVDNIDKKVPQVEVKYSETKTTNKDVVATVTLDKEAKLITEDEAIVKVDSTKYEVTFTKNDVKSLEFIDKAGNRTTINLEVTWIDKTMPTVEVTYSETELTNKDVVATLTFSEDVTILNENVVDGKITFTENGKYTIEFVDVAGNKNSVDVEVTWIDKTIPTAEVSYSTTDITNKDVVATLTFSKDVTILTEDIVKDGKVTFTENGKHTIEFVDKAENANSVDVEVTWIDKTIPTAQVIYSETEATNKDVVATINFSEDVTILSGNIVDEKITFTENGKHTIEFVDAAGNKNSVIVEVTWIDKTIPTAEVSYSTIELTNEDVIATLTFSEDVTILTEDIVKNGKITFTENGKYTIEFVDAAGNKNSVLVKVDNIDKTVPEVNVSYSKTELTKEDVIATLTFNEDVTLVTEDIDTLKISETKYEVTFIKNDVKSLEFKDKAGNKTIVNLEVTWMDKDLPEVNVEYSTTEQTIENVTARLSFNKKVKILNKDIEFVDVGNNTYEITFTQNNKYVVEFVDEVGNKNTAVVEVENIDKTAPEVEITYSETELTNKDVEVTLKFSEEVFITTNLDFVKVEKNTYKIVFTRNGEHTIKFVDKVGNRNTAKIVVENIDKTAPEVTTSYSQTTLTNEDVVATFVFSKKVHVVTEDVTLDKKADNIYTMTITENTDRYIEFADEAGNIIVVNIVVNCIDKVAPVANVEYSTTELTNEDVIATLTFSEDVTILSEDIVKDGKITFTENGKYTIKFVDNAGNTNSVDVEVTWIDKNIPNVKVEYSTTELTNKDVVATLTFDKDVTIISDLDIVKLEDNVYTYTFSENAEYVVEFEDRVGNRNTAKIGVSCIDKIAPTAQLEYSTTETTYSPVIVTLKPSETIKVNNNHGLNTYTFEDNGTFTFEIEDKAGNISTVEAKVDWIRKKHDIKLVYDIDTLTNTDVTVELISKNDITITNNDGSTTYTFITNGEFTFEYVDEYGETGSVTARVDWIDKEAPDATFEFNTTQETTNPVMVTLVANEEVTILNNNGSDRYVFTENGEFTFEFEDKAGNKSSKTVVVDWIRDIPGVSIEYSIKEVTDQNVIVKVVADDGELTILNNDGKDTYVFTENGEFTFEYEDKYGNSGVITAKVDWIDKTIHQVVDKEEEKPQVSEIIPDTNVEFIESNFVYYEVQDELEPQEDKDESNDKDKDKKKQDKLEEKIEEKKKQLMVKQDPPAINNEDGQDDEPSVVGLVVVTSAVVSSIILLILLFVII